MSQKSANIEKDKPQEWEVTGERFVGFIDIMGFKDMVARNDHKEVYEKLKIISDFKSTAEEPMYSDNPLKSFIFSDSVVIFSINSNNDEFRDLLIRIRQLMETLLEKAIPFRGAIACGTITVDVENSIFFGQPLIDAYLLGEELSLYAIALHHTAEKFVDGKSIDIDFSKGKRFHKYLTPMKNGSASHRLLAPFKIFFKKNRIDAIEEGFNQMTSGSLRKYVDNTSRFLKEIYDNRD